MKRSWNRLILGGLSIAVLLAGPLGEAAMAAPPDSADAVGVSERDVFEIVGAALRNPDNRTPPDAQLFSVAGVALGLTWGEWSAASAQSTVRANNSHTDVRLTLTGLIPGGHYSVFWGTLGPDSEHPGCPGVERTLPLDAMKPAEGALDPNSFSAGADGSATYRGRTGGNLLGAQQVFFNVVYHLYDDRSAYPFPNLGEYLSQGPNCRSTFGEDSMRHVQILQKW